MIRAEYLRFLQTIQNDTISPDIRKVANLVLGNLNSLVPLGTTQGQRIKHVVALAQASWTTLSTDIQPLTEQIDEQVSSIKYLKSLTVGPFRGFAKQEVFDLESRQVLIYGPNGTGKSSFCEALEYALLGNVAEAENKRFREQPNYLKNAHTNTFLAPVIMGCDSNNQTMRIDANEALYRFCFVEKNRIDSFSRIAAQAPAKQIELISTLFGLDAFNDFINNFSSEIDNKYIDVIGVKASEVARKRLSLSGSHQLLASNNLELQKLNDEELVLARQYGEGKTFVQMMAELNGDSDNLGLIKRLENELQQPVANKSGLNILALNELRTSIYTKWHEVSAKEQELTTASQQVSFKQLYEAVSQLQSSTPDHCPACYTPLEKVTINPYNHASSELQKLQHLSKLQQEIQQLNQSINRSLGELSQIINTCCSRLAANPVHNYQLSPTTQATIAWWHTLLQPMLDGFTPWQHIEAQVTQLAQDDIKLEQLTQQRTSRQAELSKLREFSHQITILQTRKQTAQDAIKAAQHIITNFDTENAALIESAVNEKVIVEQNQAIANAYAIFVKMLNKYKDKLPEKLVANLGERVVELYNSFNRYDKPSELLANVQLPLGQNQRLKISFQNNPSKDFDALHVLSEGHIRCIGLAILLAKNINEACPLLIFDDPVNAIDDEHREAIRKTLFEDDFFADRQIIIACHGEEFFKDIQNLLPAQQAKQAKTFSFLPRLDEAHIRIEINSTPRNYILAARGHLDRYEIRDALSKSRQALEAMTKTKLWSYIRKHSDGNLNLRLGKADAPLELRNLSDQLKAKIAKNDFSDINKDVILTPLNSLLQVGNNGISREWHYLNKGTHEDQDRPDFDRHVVCEIVTALEVLDAALTT